ncbi:Scr1 family TA system antitoxin-like transcriptional regulator [Micromonospora sp. HK10]|uniref:Scr1 family TA system antitoxin-like transcriptional regulator n=1 Tax=Micromonospora sp. HK10 TaxID=1538294 RepID=UPI0006271E68|nr:Scr1 family TA system antitoxin-like transcriptional regulator [Micromonospora sp. HK10]KKK00013.1 hypothetical protein LQ51_21750 [Micromonospora sp. HK10]
MGQLVLVGVGAVPLTATALGEIAPAQLWVRLWLPWPQQTHPEARPGAGTCGRCPVIPADGPWHTGLAGPFMLARLPDGSEVAYLDNQLRGEIVSDPLDVANLERRWESVTGEALPTAGRSS